MTESRRELAQNVSPGFIHQPRRGVSALLGSPENSLAGCRVATARFSLVGCAVHDLDRFGVQVFDFLLDHCADSMLRQVHPAEIDF